MSFKAELGSYQETFNAALSQLKDNDIIKRIWEHDHTVWQPDPEEIINRLDWLTIADDMAERTEELNAFAEEVHEAGYEQALLLGMGGSSLAPEVFSRVFGTREGHLDLTVLDSTDPDAVHAIDETLDYEKTLFIVASKSGGTAETLSLFKYFYNRAVAELGQEEVGSHFAAVTDPGSRLVKLGAELSFRRVFENNPNIGGRYSALSYFGLVPAALLGVDLDKLLERAQSAMAEGKAALAENPAAQLGAVMGALAGEGRDKLTLLASADVESFGDWVEQLVAESTGKAGKGILPVVSEPLGAPAVYGDDRVFVHLSLDNDKTHQTALNSLVEEGHPLITLELDDVYDLGAQFVIWELATAVAGHLMNIHPFNQPNVEAAKVLARTMIDEYEKKGELPDGEIAPLEADALRRFLDSSETGDYITLQAFVQPEEETTAALAALRLALRDHYKLATAAAYGPRYLHSTGQLHKGDAGNGLFIQFISEPENTADIPEEPGVEESVISFGVLRDAQALGDAQALRDEKRRIIRFNLGDDVIAGLTTLTEAFT
jgi:glucose-6-phosphate isomerase